MKAKNKKKLTEVEIATVIQHYFSSKNWDLFPEVVISIFDGRPDFVGKKGDLCAAIECKTSLTYPVLEQLIRWPLSYQEKVDSEYQDASTSGIPHLLFAVTGETSGTYSFLKEKVLNDYRIGHLEVRHEGTAFGAHDYANGEFCPNGYANIDGQRWRVITRTEAKIQPGSRKTAKNILALLEDDMKVAQAGVTGVSGNYMTPFRRTMERAKSALSCYHQCHIAHLVEHINRELGGHHYSSDRQACESIGKFLIEFDIAESEDGIPIFWLKGTTRKGFNTERKT